MPVGCAGGDGAGGISGREFAAIGDVDCAVNTSAFCERTEIDVGGAGDGPVVHQQRAVEIERVAGDIQRAAGIDDDARAATADEGIAAVEQCAAAADCHDAIVGKSSRGKRAGVDGDFAAGEIYSAVPGQRYADDEVAAVEMGIDESGAGGGKS